MNFNSLEASQVTSSARMIGTPGGPVFYYGHSSDITTDRSSVTVCISATTVSTVTGQIIDWHGVVSGTSKKDNYQMNLMAQPIRCVDGCRAKVHSHHAGATVICYFST